MHKYFRVARLLVVAVVVAAFAVPAAPVAAQEVAAASWSMSTNPITIKRGGQAYQMRIHAFEMGNTESVSVSLSQTRDPSGVTKATQSHTYTFSLSGDRFTHASTLAKAKLATAKQMGQYGALSLSFAKNAATNSTCKGHVKTRTGTLSGTVSLKTGTKLFGTITNRPGKAILTYHNGKCTSGQYASPGTGGPCPTVGMSASAFRHDPEPMLSMFASKAKGAKVASLNLFSSGPMKVSNGYLSRSIIATVPAAKVTIADNLSSAKVSGVSVPWLSGAGNFTSSGQTFPGSPTACGKGKEYVTSTRMGEWKGTLKANFFIGADPSLSQGAAGGSAMKTVVRSA
jgi:hypothetical protein